MILVADASALVALAACDGLHLLDALFGEVWVPEAVLREVVIVGKPQSARLSKYLEGKVRAVDMQHFVFLDAFADAGETAAMLLYKELGAGQANRACSCCCSAPGADCRKPCFSGPRSG